MAHGPSLGGQTHEHTEADISDLDHTDPEAIHDNVSGEINALTEKASPVDADLVIIEDSEASYAKKKAQLINLSASGDIVYANSDLATGSTVTDAGVTTLASKALTLAVGDVLLMETLIVADNLVTGEGYGCFLNIGSQFTDTVGAAASEYVTPAGDMASVHTSVIMVASTSLVWRVNWTRAYDSSHAVTTAQTTVGLSSMGEWNWQNITSDETGSKTINMNAVVGASDSIDMTWATTWRQFNTT